MKKLIAFTIGVLALLYTTSVAWCITPDSSGNLEKKVKVSSNDSTSGYLNGKLVAGANLTFTEGSDGGNETLTIAATGTLGVATIADEATPLTQRATVNMIGAGVSCVDNSGSTRTDCTISGASTHTVQEGDSNVSSAVTTVDYTAADFDVTESPAGEVNVSLSSAVATLTGSQTLTNKTLTTPIIASISNSGTVTVPTGTDTLVNLAGTQTLTNKTLDGTDSGAGTTRGSGSDIIRHRSHDTDCTSLTDGKANELCYEEDTNSIYVCEPSAGDCDTAGEWLRNTASVSAYDTVQDEGSGLTARTTLNFIGSAVSCVDNASKTECTISSGSATFTTQADDSTIDASTSTLDFLNDFTLTSSPSGETNVSVKTDSLDFAEMVDAMTADPTHVTVTNTNYMRLGDGSSNYSMFGTNGALTYAGSGKPARTIDLTPSGSISPASNGATKANTDGTNFSYPQASFSGTGSDVNSLYWTFFKMPDSYDDAATISCYVAWKTTSTTDTNGVVWQLAASGRADAELFDSSLGSFATVTDNPSTVASRIMVSSAITLTTNFTSGEYVIFQLKRDAAHASDTDTAAAVFLGLACEYLVDAETD